MIADVKGFSAGAEPGHGEDRRIKSAADDRTRLNGCASIQPAGRHRHMMSRTSLRSGAEHSAGQWPIDDVRDSEDRSAIVGERDARPATRRARQARQCSGWHRQIGDHDGDSQPPVVYFVFIAN